MRTGRLRTIAITLAMLVVIGAAGAYIATEYGRSRAITVIAAIGLIAALVWVVLTIVSIVTATNARARPLEEDDETLRNQQRPVARRTILPGDDKQVGRRRKD